MNNFIKQIIEEKFASKAQQRFFYAQAGKGGKKGKKWSKWAKEFSKDTDFKKIPEKVEKEVDEIVDDKGNIQRSKKPVNFSAKGTTQMKTTDDVIKAGAGSMGIHGVHGTHTSLKYWAESDLSKALGAKDTIMKDADFDDRTVNKIGKEVDKSIRKKQGEYWKALEKVASKVGLKV